MSALITNRVHRRLEGPPESAAAALRHLEPLQPLRDALAALGLGHLVSVCRMDAPVHAAPELASFSLTWRLGHRSVARIAWTLSITPIDDHESLLSASVRAGTDSADARQQLLAAWPLLGRIVEAHTTRLLNAATELAEQFTDASPELQPVPHLAAA
jgi:hypothetical protein